MDQPSITDPGVVVAPIANSSDTSVGPSSPKRTPKGSKITDPAVLAMIIQQSLKYWQDAGNSLQIANTSRGLVVLLPSLHLAGDGSFTLDKKGE